MNGNRCNVLATALDETGAGVCTVEGPAPGGDAALELHIGDLLPGERAEVMLDHRSPHKPIGWGHVLRKLGEPSADRVAPPCPAFGRCGGRVWQHLAYPPQLVEKHRPVASAPRAPAPYPSLPPPPGPRAPRTKGHDSRGPGRGAGAPTPAARAETIRASPAGARPAVGDGTMGGVGSATMAVCYQCRTPR